MFAEITIRHERIEGFRFVFILFLQTQDSEARFRLGIAKETHPIMRPAR